MFRALCPFVMTLPLLALTACTQFPDLDRTQTAALDAADYPALVPIEPILAANSGAGPDPVTEEAALNARLNALRARAGRMRGSVLTGTEKQRLAQGLQ